MQDVGLQTRTGIMDCTRPLFGVISEPAVARFKMASSWSSVPSIAANGRFLAPTEGG